MNGTPFSVHSANPVLLLHVHARGPLIKVLMGPLAPTVPFLSRSPCYHMSVISSHTDIYCARHSLCHMGKLLLWSV